MSRGPGLGASTPLFDFLAPHYDEHFAVPHRKAYDDLAWEFCAAALPEPPAVVVDLGCGVGRWTERLLSSGYVVVGIEPSPRMAEFASARLAAWTGSGFTLVHAPVEEVRLPPGSADAVLAIGSLQYTVDPTETMRQAARWLRPGGSVCVLVDSLHALVLELIGSGRQPEALERLTSRRGTWRVDGHAADLHLFDVASLRAAMTDSCLDVVQVAGLLVGASAFGREELCRRLVADPDRALDAERTLGLAPCLADLGKQLLMIGRRVPGAGP